MRKIIIMFAVAVLLVSCGKVPREKLDTANYCIDSLKNVGAESSLKFANLQKKMTEVNDGIEVQSKLLFKKYADLNVAMDEIISESRSFVITNDKPLPRIQVVTSTNVTAPNSVRLEVQIDFDSKQDALRIANLVDEAVRNNMNLNAKLIRVKIIE